MEFYRYISSLAGCDPCKTVFLCAPENEAKSSESLRKFAESSGWIKAAEEDGAVLIAPIVKDGWDKEPEHLLKDLYNEVKGNCPVPEGNEGLPHRKGLLWLWETLIYGVGYKEGASFLARQTVSDPNLFSAVVLSDGGTEDFSKGKEESDHWLISNPSDDYNVKNQDVPSALWIFGNDESMKKTASYIRGCDRTDKKETKDFDGCNTTVYYNHADTVLQVRESKEEEIPADTVMSTFFNKIMRWKNSGDGTLQYCIGKKDYYRGNTYLHDSVESDGISYHFGIYLPEGMSKEEAKGLPVVLSIHGAGEPSWIFATKNGWERLADETRDFVVVLPDSPQNVWVLQRDLHSISNIVEKLINDYGFDEERIYITGFSNGSIFTKQQASTFPHLFAAASPWNGPSPKDLKGNTTFGSYIYEPSFSEGEWEMPFWHCVGDNDSKASAGMENDLAETLKPNGCDESTAEVWNGNNHYTAIFGYSEGERFNTKVYRNKDGIVMAGATVMKNMPHGAVYDESRAAWEFMRRFKRRKNEKKVSLTEEEE